MDRRTLLGAGAALTALPSAAFAKGDPVATGTTGRWQGKADGATQAFLGIRYGSDTSHTRFRAATAPAPSSVRRPITDARPDRLRGTRRCRAARTATRRREARV